MKEIIGRLVNWVEKYSSEIMCNYKDQFRAYKNFRIEYIRLMASVVCGVIGIAK